MSGLRAWEVGVVGKLGIWFFLFDFLNGDCCVFFYCFVFEIFSCTEGPKIYRLVKEAVNDPWRFDSVIDVWKDPLNGLFK